MKYTVLLVMIIALASLSWMTILRDASDDAFDQEVALEELRNKIEGVGDDPAETVFENIETLKGFPAKRLLTIMELGFSRSLGVDCTHCHNPGDWASEEKLTKQIARDMWEMVGSINREMLTAIPNLSSEMAFVNCTTCHR